jgi:hypothetical protein
MQPEDPDTQSPNHSRKKSSRKERMQLKCYILIARPQKGSIVINSLTTAQKVNERGTDTPGCVCSMIHIFHLFYCCCSVPSFLTTLFELGHAARPTHDRCKKGIASFGVVNAVSEGTRSRMKSPIASTRTARSNNPSA